MTAVLEKSAQPAARPGEWHEWTAEEVALRMGVDAAVGLSERNAAEQLRIFGHNELREKAGTPRWMLFLRQFQSPLIYVLLGAAVVALSLGEFKDAGVICFVMVVNAAIGFIQEGRAERSMAALKKLSAPQSRVRRDGKILTVPSSTVVPGDVLILAAGDRIGADARLTEATVLIALEGALTGESTGVTKRVAPISGYVALADRRNMVFAGTNIASGRGEAIVVATGMRTELGKIAALVQETVEPPSPLQLRIKNLSRIIVVTTLAVMPVVFLIGLLRGLPAQNVFMVVLSQIVSVIPEGLPVAVTIALAVGMQRIARKRAIIRKLGAVDTLGSATIICTDKTGTLTKNEMSVTRLFVSGETIHVTGIGYDPTGEFRLPNGQLPSPATQGDWMRLLEVGALCNDAHLRSPMRNDSWQIEGDPTEGALIVAATKAGLDAELLRHESPREWEIPFDPSFRLMATAHRHGHLHADLRVCVKGAPEEVLSLCHAYRRGSTTDKLPAQAPARQVIIDAQRAMAAEGLRVLAFAEAQLPSRELTDHFECLRGRLVFLGLTGQMDPPRPEAREALALCRNAGIRTVMVTGDHLLTGQAVATELGIANKNSLALEGSAVRKMSESELDLALDRVAVFGRVAPEHKLRIVEGFQRKGHVVAMTGDGVNDAPALTKADIGVAMGVTGTEVAKSAAAMVITDDNFASIVSAVEEGRVIFSNIRKTVFYLFSTSAAEIVALTTALLAGLPLPLRAAQILWINLVTDGLLDINLVMEKAEGDEMRRPPARREAGILSRASMERAALLIPVMGFGTAGLFAWALASGRSYEHAQTLAFTVLVAFQWFNILNARSHLRSVFQIGFFGNKFLLAGLLASVVLQVMSCHAPFMQVLFNTVPLGWTDWVIVLAVASTVVWADELRKLWLRRRLVKFQSQGKDGGNKMNGSVRTRLRDAVFGAQDGLVSTLGTVTGIAAGTQNPKIVVLSGLVVVAVESLSMAAGSYLSSKSQREYMERLLLEETEAIATDPEGERREIWKMYRERGYSDHEIGHVVERLMSNPKLLLEDMAHKELGICPETLEEPLGNAITMGVTYIIGGFVPLLPYLLLPIATAIPVSIIGTLTALFAFGGLKGRFVRQRWWRSGLEMLLVASVAALVGFGIGSIANTYLQP